MSKYTDTIAALRAPGPTPPNVVERAMWQMDELLRQRDELLKALEFVHECTGDAWDYSELIARVKASQ